MLNTSVYSVSHNLRLHDYIVCKVSKTDYIDTTQWLQAAKQHTSCEHKKIVSSVASCSICVTGDKTYRVPYERQSRVVVQETASHVCVKNYKQLITNNKNEKDAP